MHWNQKKNTIFIFYYPSQTFALWQKIALPQNFYPNTFYSLDPLYQILKSKLGDILLHTGVTPATGL